MGKKFFDGRAIYTNPIQPLGHSTPISSTKSYADDMAYTLPSDTIAHAMCTRIYTIKSYSWRAGYLVEVILPANQFTGSNYAPLSPNMPYITLQKK